MRIGIVAGLGIGIALLFGSTSDAAEANGTVPAAAAPIPLVPEVYAVSSAPVAPAASHASTTSVAVTSLRAAPVPPIASPATATAVAVAPSPVETRSSSPSAPAVTSEGQAMPAPVVKFNQYHPHWVVALH
jgi:hypothetical protein